MSPFEAGNVRLPRRRLLALLPAIAAPVLIPKAALAAPTGSKEPLTLTAADSLYYYQKLLSDVNGEANYLIAGDAIRAGKSCNDKLDKIRVKLQKLYERLSAVSSHNANWPALRDQFRVVDRNLLLVQQADPVHYSPQSMNLLPVTTASVASLLLQISSHCDPDPDGQIKAMLKEILQATDEQNNQIGSLSAEQIKLQQQLKITQENYFKCSDYLNTAMTKLSQGEDARNDLGNL